MNEPETTCFHCALPVPVGTGWTLHVSGAERRFCCPGCLAVCETIVAAGLEDYYRHREVPGDSVRESVPELLRRLELYDRPEIQAGFVRQSGGQREASLILENIHCPACLWLNEHHLRSIPGVLDVEIDYNSERARVVWDAERIQLSEILKAISDIGYVAHPYDPAHRDELIKLQRRRSAERLIFAGAIGMAMMQFALATYIMGQPSPNGDLPLWVILGRWTALLATTALLIFSGQEFLLSAWNDWKRRRLGMDVPIVIGLGVAYLGSIAATVAGRGEVYFDSIAMFVLFLLVARRFELKGRLEAAKVLDQLARVIPRFAHRLEPDGAISEVPVVDLRRGDRLRIRPGDTVPVDGVVMEGTSRFDESVITGESAPVSRVSGDAVVAGSRNLEHPILLEVTRRDEESTLAELEHLLRRGMRSRPRSALLAERVTAFFVPGILVLAALTAALWIWLDPEAALANTVAVLIVTCPCALALATPVAVSIGVSRFAAAGVLPLRMEALEGASRADTMVFDKTGTLTEGRLRLVERTVFGDIDEATVLSIAAALERDSEHPIAQVFREATPAEELTVEQRRNQSGRGVSGLVVGAEWRLGTPQFACAESALAEEVSSELRRFEHKGYTAVMLSRNGSPSALFALGDRPRPRLEETLRELRRRGVRQLVVLSGDNQGAVDYLVRGLDVDLATGGCTPQDKMQWVRDRQAEGRRVVMVGDGVNDAATLAAADVSISFARASDLARASSDFLLMGQDLHAIVVARDLARRTRRTIVQNLLWALGYNAIAVPCAMLGLIAPWGAAIGMSLSSLLVVANSLRLRRASGDRHRGRADSVAPPNPGLVGLR